MVDRLYKTTGPLTLKFSKGKNLFFKPLRPCSVENSLPLANSFESKLHVCRPSRNKTKCSTMICCNFINFVNKVVHAIL